MSVVPRGAGRLAAAAAAQLGSCGPRLQCAQLQTAAAGADAGGEEPKAELPRRFYKTAHVAPAEGQGYQVLLDRRVLKTPAGKPLLLPSRLLALAVAAEWEQQEAKVIRPFTMPLMTLAATALDEPKPRANVVATLLQYLHTDSACCRDEPGTLAERQAEVFDPVVRWVEGQLGAPLQVGSSLMGMRQSSQLLDGARAYLSKLDRWQLAATDAAAAASRSVVIGMALVQGRLSVAGALEAARVEEDHQILNWGLVEGGHDIDIADAAARVSAAALFARFVRGEAVSGAMRRPGLLA